MALTLDLETPAFIRGPNVWLSNYMLAKKRAKYQEDMQKAQNKAQENAGYAQAVGTLGQSFTQPIYDVKRARVMAGIADEFDEKREGRAFERSLLMKTGLDRSGLEQYGAQYLESQGEDAGDPNQNFFVGLRQSGLDKQGAMADQKLQQAGDTLSQRNMYDLARTQNTTGEVQARQANADRIRQAQMAQEAEDQSYKQREAATIKYGATLPYFKTPPGKAYQQTQTELNSIYSQQDPFDQDQQSRIGELQKQKRSMLLQGSPDMFAPPQPPPPTPIAQGSNTYTWQDPDGKRRVANAVPDPSVAPPEVTKEQRQKSLEDSVVEWKGHFWKQDKNRVWQIESPRNSGGGGGGGGGGSGGAKGGKRDDDWDKAYDAEAKIEEARIKSAEGGGGKFDDVSVRRRAFTRVKFGRQIRQRDEAESQVQELNDNITSGLDEIANGRAQLAQIEAQANAAGGGNVPTDRSGKPYLAMRPGMPPEMQAQITQAREQLDQREQMVAAMQNQSEGLSRQIADFDKQFEEPEKPPPKPLRAATDADRARARELLAKQTAGELEDSEKAEYDELKAILSAGGR